MRQARAESGFTLLEVLVASTVMALAVVGLLASLSTSLRNSSRVTDADRASLVARTKMNELLSQSRVTRAEVGGAFAPAESGWERSGWRAIVQPYDVPPAAQPGVSYIVERIRLEIWWMSGTVRRTYALDGYRAGRMMVGDRTVRP